MTKLRLFVIAAAGFVLLLAMLTLPFQVNEALGEGLLQTWPSRTPTPPGGPGPTSTSPPPATDDDPDNPPNDTPAPGDTAVPPAPGDTATPTTAATVVLETPPGGYEATAEPCGMPPTVQALGVVNIRSGPGLEYDPIENLIYLETRPIIGRAEFATWWQIQLPSNVTGWVANQAVSVQGYTGAVPIVTPPLLDGATPTPGPLWQPTPNPVCTPQPTPTATSTAVIEAAQPTTQVVSNANPTQAPPEPTATATTEPAPPTETMAVATEPATSTAAPETGSPITEETQLDNPADESGGSASSWILFAGIGLVAVAAVSVIFRRR